MKDITTPWHSDLAGNDLITYYMFKKIVFIYIFVIPLS